MNDLSIEPSIDLYKSSRQEIHEPSPLKVSKNPHFREVQVFGSHSTMHNGIEINEYAKYKNLSVEQVWNLVKSGCVFAKTIAGNLMIFEPNHSFDEDATLKSNNIQKSTHVPSFLPPLPMMGATSNSSQTFNTNLPTIRETEEPVPFTEMALFLDHLSLVKEGNREILKLARESVSQLSTLTDNVIMVKDALLQSKDQEIEHLKMTLVEKEKNLKKIQQDCEDLGMLVKTLSKEE